MSRQRRRPVDPVVALAFGAVLAGVALSPLPASAGAGPRPADPHGTAATGTPAFPTFVHLPADQAAHPDAEWEWWYVVGHVDAHGHRFGYEVQIVNGSAPHAYIAITDKTTGEYFPLSQSYPPDRTSFSTTALDARVPSATLSGPMDAMRLHATLPAGAIDLTLRARGPALYNNGTGLMPFLDGTSYYYSLPSLDSRGTITVNGRDYPVTGRSWLDRQWGDWDWTVAAKWTWMALQLSNGDRIALWDLFTTHGREFPYATVLRPDGTHEVVAVTPLAGGTSRFWTSPVTGKRYGTRWSVSIPALGGDLVVTVEPQGQELDGYGGIYEGAGEVHGRYRGRPVTGQVYVEQLGNWR